MTAIIYKYYAPGLMIKAWALRGAKGKNRSQKSNLSG